MVQIVAHGGGCCGARHIHTFRDDTNPDREVQTFERIVIEASNHTLLEVILSGLQARSKPLLLEKLAELGFVLTSQWIGNHNTPVLRFEIAGRMRSLNQNDRFTWNGMRASATLTGDLPLLNTGQERIRGRNGFEIGERVRINSPTSVLHQEIHRIARFDRDPRTGAIKAVINTRGRDYSIVVGNLQATGEQAGRHQNQPLQRHEEEEGGQAQPQQEPTVLFSTYHNHYRRGGRGAGFDTLQEAVDAAPRCRRRERRDIMSDGSINWSAVL